MILLVTGGRDYANHEKVYAVLDALWEQEHFVLLHGGARGADKHADNWAKERGAFVIACPVYAKTWERYGNKAGPSRNRLMAALRPNAVVAFPGGDGTEDMVSRVPDITLHDYR